MFMEHPIYPKIVSVACFPNNIHLVFLECCFSFILGSVIWSNTHRLKSLCRFLCLYFCMAGIHAMVTSEKVKKVCIFIDCEKQSHTSPTNEF